MMKLLALPLEKIDQVVALPRILPNWIPGGEKKDILKKNLYSSPAVDTGAVRAK
jgi:hypothetical protein